MAVAGANPGEVVLVGGGDPTLAGGKTGYYPGAARLDVLAEQVRKALGGTAPTKVIVDGSLYSGPAHEPGWDSDIPTGGYGGTISALMIDGARNDPKSGQGYAERSAEPELAAGQAFAAALGLPASAVSAGRAPRAGAASGGDRRRAGGRCGAGPGRVRADGAAGGVDAGAERQLPRRGAGPPGRPGPGQAGLVRRFRRRR